MGYTFTFGDIEKICRSLDMEPVKKGSRFWQGFGPDGRFRRTRIDSHGSGRPVATGTARRMAEQLLFRDLEDMYLYLRDL
jgi:hypothetical protein